MLLDLHFFVINVTLTIPRPLPAFDGLAGSRSIQILLFIFPLVYGAPVFADSWWLSVARSTRSLTLRTHHQCALFPCGMACVSCMFPRGHCVCVALTPLALQLKPSFVFFYCASLRWGQHLLETVFTCLPCLCFWKRGAHWMKRATVGDALYPRNRAFSEENDAVLGCLIACIFFFFPKNFFMQLFGSVMSSGFFSGQV